MLDFNKYVTRYGEFGVQDIIERLERTEGLAVRTGVSLEQRWNLLMQVDYSLGNSGQERLAA